MGQVLIAKEQVAPAVPAPLTVNGAPVVGKTYPTYLYTDLIVTYPTIVLSVTCSAPFLLALITLINVDMNSVDKESTAESFTIKDHETIQLRDITEAAVEEWRHLRESYVLRQQELTASVRSNLSIGAGVGFRSVPWKRIYIQYNLDVPPLNDLTYVERDELLEKYNILDDEHSLRYIRYVESQIVQLKSWESACWTTNLRGGVQNVLYPVCAPLVSLIQYFFPGKPQNISLGWHLDCSACSLPGMSRGVSITTPEGTKTCPSSCVPAWSLDMTGDMHPPTSKSLDIFLQNPKWQWYTNTRLDDNNRRAYAVRTQITLGIGPWDSTQSQQKDVDAFVKDLMRFMKAARNGKSPSGVSLSTWPNGSTLYKPDRLKITIGGDGVEDAMIENALRTDKLLIVAGAFTVFAAVSWYVNSIFIGCITLLQIIMTYFTATILYMATTGDELSLLSVMALYVTLGMTCNGSLVFFMTFRHSGLMPTSGRRNTLNVPQRLAFCFRKAGVGITVSHLSVLVAFSCNAVSPVPAVKGFGILMVIIVFINVFLFLTFYPSAIVWHHYHVSGKRRNAQRQKEVLMRVMRRPKSLVRVVNDVEDTRLYNGCSGWLRSRYIMHTAKTDDDVCIQGGGIRDEFVMVTQNLNPFIKGDSPPSRSPNRSFKEETKLWKRAQLDASTSRRKQTPEEVVRIDKRFTVFNTELDKTTLPEIVPPAAPCSNDDLLSPRAQAARQSGLRYGAKVSSGRVHRIWWKYWDEVAHAVGITPCRGELDLRTGISTLGAKRLPQIAQCLHDSINRGPSGFSPLVVVNGVRPEKPPEDFEVDVEQRALVAENATPPCESADVLSPVTMASDTMGQQALCAEEEGEDISCQKKEKRRRRRKRKVTPWERMKQWFEDRVNGPKRRFGLFGKRVGETREEKDKRILAKEVRQEGFSSLERAMRNVVVPGMRKTWYVWLLAWAVASLVFAIAGVRHLEPEKDVPRMLRDSMQEEFVQASHHFGIEGNCDFCGPYLRPLSDWPAFDRKSLELCGGNMHAKVDQCGVCQPMGVTQGLMKSPSDFTPNVVVANGCLDCRGTPHGTASIMCGKCVANSSEMGGCMECGSGDTSRLGWCSLCYLAGKSGPCDGVPNAPPCLYGENCDVKCNEEICPPERGRCDPFSGECVCHSDEELGFWYTVEGSPSKCSECLPGTFSTRGTQDCRRHCFTARDVCSCDETTCPRCPGVSIGSACKFVRRNACLHGTASPVTGLCICDEGWSGRYCSTHARCSDHGVYWTNPKTGAKECMCFGQWGGETCDMCKCHHGGRCDEESGKCYCEGAWDGYDCTGCRNTCLLRGSCPTPWPSMYSPENQYKRRQAGQPALIPPIGDQYRLCSNCRGFFTGPLCERCLTEDIPGAEGLRCLPTGGVIGCDGKPMSMERIMVEDKCGVCGGNNNCIGCDGVRGSRKTLDLCGKCGGDNICGGASPARVDIVWGLMNTRVARREAEASPELRCTWEFLDPEEGWKAFAQEDSLSIEEVWQTGRMPQDLAICIPHGFRHCKSIDATVISTYQQGPTVMSFDFDKMVMTNISSEDTLPIRQKHCVYDLQFSIADPATQEYLHWICRMLVERDDLVNPFQSTCFMLEFAHFLTRFETRALFGKNISFPYTGSNFAQVLYEFVQQQRRFDEVGFSTGDYRDPNLRVLWIRFRLVLHVSELDDTLTLLNKYDLWERIVFNINNPPWSNTEKPKTTSTCFQWSPTWISAFTEVQAKNGTIYALVLSGVTFFALTLIFSCSPLITVMAVTCFAAVALWIATFMHYAGWTLGPVEQIGLSVISGITSECLVHIIEGYIEHLHAVHSTLLAVSITRGEALGGALQRTGIPIVVSTMLTSICTMFLLPAKLAVFQRAAQILLLIYTVAALHGLVIFGCMLVVAGPTELIRTRHHMMIFFLGITSLGLLLSCILLATGEVRDPQGGRVL